MEKIISPNFSDLLAPVVAVVDQPVDSPVDWIDCFGSCYWMPATFEN